MKSKRIIMFFVLLVTLFTLAACTGDVGPEGPQGPQGEQGLPGEQGEQGLPGEDGREVEFQLSSTHIQYRYVGSAAWMDLIPLSSLTGPQGPIGLTGQDGKDGDEVLLQLTDTHLQWKYVGAAEWTNLLALSSLIGETGKSAYEAYVEAYPGYTADEATWLFELANNELRVVLTVVYSNGYVDLVNYVKGQPIGASPYDVPWFLDAAYTQAADSHYMSADTTVYINKVHPVVPVEVAGVHEILTIDQVGTTLNPIYRLVMTDGTVLELGEFFNLYAADGQFIATTPKAILEIAGNTAAPKLKAGDIVTDVVQELGKVTSLRFASENVEIATKSSSVLTVAGGVVTVAYGTTVAQVLENIKPLASVDSRVQTYAVRKGSDDSIVASGNIATSQYLEVISENGSSRIYDFAIGKNPDTTLKLAKNPAWQMVAIDNVLKEVHVRPGTLASDITTSLTSSNTDFVPSFYYVNSQGILDPAASKKDGALFNGDKLVVVAEGYASSVYYVRVVESASTDLKLVANPGPKIVSVNNTTGVITVLWNTTTDDLVAALPDLIPVDGADLSSVVFKYDGKTVYDGETLDLDDVPDLIQKQTVAKFFELVVKSQDELITKSYKFAIQASKSNVIEVKDSALDHIANLSGTDLSVREDLTVAQLLLAIQSDDTSVQTYLVKNSEGVTKVGTAKLYLGDKLVVTPAFGGTPEEYLITVKDKFDTTDLEIIADAEVVLSTNGQISLNPQFILGSAYINTTIDKVISELDFAYWAQTYRIEKISDSSVLTLAEARLIPLDEIRIVVIAQDGSEKPLNLFVNPESKSVEFNLVESPKVVLNDPSTSNPVVKVAQQTGNYINTTIDSILADLDLHKAFNTYALYRDVSGVWTVTTLSTARTLPLSQVAIEIIPQDSTADNQMYTISVDSNPSTAITPIEDAKVYLGVEAYIGDAPTVTQTIVIAPQYVSSGNYVNATVQRLLADINLAPNYQKSKEALMLNTSGDYINFSGTDLSELFVRITAQDGTKEVYAVRVEDKSQDVTLNITDADVARLSEPSTVNVAYGTTVAQLVAALDLVSEFQTVVVYQNDGITAKTGTAVLADYNIIRITAQDPTTLVPYRDYTIMVDDAPVVGSAALKSTEAKYVVDNVNMTITIKTTLANINGGVAVATVRAKLATIDGLTEIVDGMFFASDGASKDGFGLFNDDILVFTPTGSSTEVVYTIKVIVG